MKPEYRSLDTATTPVRTPENLATLLTLPAVSDGRTWTIGELARECDVTLRALRFYEGKGLLAPAREGAVRLYDAEDVRRLKLVLRLKRIGFSLVEIRELIDRLLVGGDADARLGALLSRVEAQVTVLEDQRREAEAALEAIVGEIDGLKRRLAG